MPCCWMVAGSDISASLNSDVVKRVLPVPVEQDMVYLILMFPSGEIHVNL